MRWLSALSIRSKLVTVISGVAILAVVLGFATVVVRERLNLQRDMVAQTELIARLAGDYSVGELAFNDREAAHETLAKLERIPEIDGAQLFDVEGREFASYQRPGVEMSAPPLVAPASVFVDGRLFVKRHVDFKGERYGSVLIGASTAPLDARIRRSLLTLNALLAVLVGLSVMLALGLHRVISGPILELARSARRVSEKEDYSLRVEKRGEDEIGTLYDAWNAMLSQIEERDEEQHRYAQALERSNQMLERSNRELERSNRELDQFAYIVSHDLKAPLRAIVNLSQWIEEDLEGRLPPESVHHLQLLNNRANRMEDLIDGVLEYSRVARQEAQEEPVDVAELVRELVEELVPPPGFEIHLGDDLPVLLTQRLLLRQVLGNLLSNALKYHHREDGRIEVAARDLGQVWQISVADDGPGIPSDCHEKIFHIFQTLQPRDRHESTGIGLAIVKKIVEEQGGQVRVESEEGAGATFIFTWPKGPGAAAT